MNISITALISLCDIDQLIDRTTYTHAHKDFEPLWCFNSQHSKPASDSLTGFAQKILKIVYKLQNNDGNCSIKYRIDFEVPIAVQFSRVYSIGIYSYSVLVY